MPRYLESHGRKWRVVVAVPRRLQAELGTKLKETLNTESLDAADRMKWAVVARLRSRFEQTEQALSQQEIITEALRWRDQATVAPLEDDDAFWDRADEIRGEPLRWDPDRPGVTIYDERREELGGLFLEVARGRATPIESLVSDWHGQTLRKERTKRDDHRALYLLNEWCALTSTRPNVEAITRQVAGRFINDLIRPSGSHERQPIARKTANKYISSLSAYWTWMETRGHISHISENVWLRQSLPAAQVFTEEAERPFTDDEIRTLLRGEPSHRVLPALMRIGALTGARIEAIASLKVRDTKDGVFVLKPQKRERGSRKVPIHSALGSIVAELTAGKADTDDLFPELPVPPTGSGRERSMPASKAFTRYRRSVGVDEVIEGRRRSRVNFHSFRRWFATKAERAGQPESIIAFVLGHSRPGMTLGRYSQGPSMDQLSTCVEAVRLPD
jgi:integrase